MKKQNNLPLFWALPVFMLMKGTNTYRTTAEVNGLKGEQRVENNYNISRDTMPPSMAGMMSNSKSDFVPGEKQVAFEDFSKSNIGDFPEGWYTNGSAEIVNGAGAAGRWLWITRPGVFLPEFTTKYPEEFTFEFDLLHGVPINGGSISISLAEIDDLAKPQNFWTGRNRLTVAFNTASTGSKTGFSTVNFRKNGTGETGNTAYTELLSDQVNPVHIALWRQKERVRVYVNQEKIWDLNKALSKETNLNAMVFFTQNAGEKIRHYISNIRLGTPVPVVPVKSVVIGTQQWMHSNLDVAFYRNGDPIPQVTDPVAWTNLTTGAWCYYNNDSAYGAIYGKLYNWYAVNDPRGLAPKGWHIPSYSEWTTLETTLGGAEISGGKLKEAGLMHWQSPNTLADNSSGFKGLPGGFRHHQDGSFEAVGTFGDWWSSTEVNTGLAWYFNLYYDVGSIYRAPNNKELGFSVRCIKD